MARLRPLLIVGPPSGAAAGVRPLLDAPPETPVPAAPPIEAGTDWQFTVPELPAGLHVRCAITAGEGDGRPVPVSPALSRPMQEVERGRYFIRLTAHALAAAQALDWGTHLYAVVYAESPREAAFRQVYAIPRPQP